MRIILAILLLSSLAMGIRAADQPLKISATVDERVELLSIVFRLAGAKEYSFCGLPDYEKKIDNHFEKFKKHKLFKHVRRIRLHGVSYDAVMSFALHIKIDESGIYFDPNISDQSLERRWRNVNKDLFLENLNHFYNQSDFRSFYESNSELYATAETNLNHQLAEVDFTWFGNFFGQEKNDRFRAIVIVSQGFGNYGPRIINSQNEEVIFAIIGSWQKDSLNMPVYPRAVNRTIIHEFNHSYCNHLIDKYQDDLRKSSKQIYRRVRDQMKAQAYGVPKTMYYEVLVRASVIKYMEHADSSQAVLQKAIAREQSLGFIWIDKVLKELSVYDSKRDLYPTLDSFMPNIVELHNSLAANFKTYKQDFNANCPRVVETSLKSKPLNAGINEITFTFSKPMLQEKILFNYGKGGVEKFPEILSREWVNDTTFKIEVNLKDNNDYALNLYKPAFLCHQYYPMLEGSEIALIVKN